MTNLTQLSSILSSVLNTQDLFKLSVAKFMYSSDRFGELPKYWDNYFSYFTSVHKYQKTLMLLQKMLFTQDENVFRPAFLKYIGPKIWFEILENFMFLTLLIWKTIQKCTAIVPIFLLFFVHILLITFL